MPERVSGLKLTGLPAELRFIYALRLRRTNIRVCQLHNDWTYFDYLENELISKINCKKSKQIFFVCDSYSHRFGNCALCWRRVRSVLSRHRLLDQKRRLPRRCNSMGYYCDSDQLTVIPEVVTSSGGPIHSSKNQPPSIPSHYLQKLVPERAERRPRN